MNEEKKFLMESLQDRKTICKYLEALKEGFHEGAIRLSHQEEQLSVEPAGLIKFAIKAKKKNGEVKLDLRFRWEEQEEAEQEPETAGKTRGDHEEQ